MSKRITLNEKRLTKKQVQELIDGGAVVAKEITEAYKSCISFGIYNIYMLPDGNYLKVFDDYLRGKGDIWPKDYVEKQVVRLKRESQRPQLRGIIKTQSL